MAACTPLISGLSYPRSTDLATRCLLKPRVERLGSATLRCKSFGDDVQLLAADATALTQRNSTVGRLHSLRAVGDDVHSDAVIGISFGVSSLGVAVMERLEVIHNSEGEEKFPCVVSLPGEGGYLVGAPAKRHALSDPTNTFYFFNLLVGRLFRDGATKALKKLVPYSIVASPKGEALVELAEETEVFKELVPYILVASPDGDGSKDEFIKLSDGKMYPPCVFAAAVLLDMKNTVKARLGKHVTKAVIAVPAYFNLSQRIATRAAGHLAGLDVLEVISVPMAAAVTHALQDKGGLIAVFHLGGATFDISIVQISETGSEVIATEGDLFKGGWVFDEELVVYLVSEFMRTESVDDPRADEWAYHKLIEAAETAKIELSSASQTEISLPGNYQGKHLKMVLTRKKFEWLVGNLIREIEKMCMRCLQKAGVSADDIDEVHLVGSMTRVPGVQDLVSEIFARSSTKMMNPDGNVAARAAIFGCYLHEGAKLLSDFARYPIQLGTLPLAPIDWRSLGAVTPSINQGICGSCWAMAVVSAVESLRYILNGVLERLSVQQVIDCAFINPERDIKKQWHGCKGGNAPLAYGFIRDHGVCREADYPYTGWIQPCDRRQHPDLVFIKGYKEVAAGNYNILAALSVQPLTAFLSSWFLYSESYRDYKGGIIFTEECPCVKS